MNVKELKEVKDFADFCSFRIEHIDVKGENFSIAFGRRPNEYFEDFTSAIDFIRAYASNPLTR